MFISFLFFFFFDEKIKWVSGARFLFYVYNKQEDRIDCVRVHCQQADCEVFCRSLCCEIFSSSRRIMSNLYSYFQRIDSKKMPAATTAEAPTTQSNTKAIKNPPVKNSPISSTRVTMSNNDIYSTDSPKSEKRKQSQERISQTNKSSIDVKIDSSWIVSLFFS